MCVVTRYIHSICDHRTHGTTSKAARVTFCRDAFNHPFAPGFPRQCVEGYGLRYNDQSVCRGYCDRCIMTGVKVMMAHGMDPDVYATSMGVSIDELMMANPGWEPG